MSRPVAGHGTLVADMSERPVPQSMQTPSEFDHRPERRKARIGVIALFVSYAAFMLISLPEYGPTWDVYHEFPRATAYVSHVLGEETPSIVSPWHTFSYEFARSSHGGSMNGCLPSLFAALTGKLFFEKLRVLDYIDAYHLGLVLLWLVFVVHFYSRISELHGPRLALVATVLLALAPRIVAHVPNNMKDIPALAFGTAGLLELAVAVTRKRPRRIYLTALLVACAVSSKFVAAFVAAPGAILVYIALRNGGLMPRIPRPYWLPLASIPIATVVLLIAHWPYLWEPPASLWARIVEMKAVAGGGRPGSGPSTYPLVMAAITTPILVLVGLVSAAAAALWKPAETRSERVLLAFYAVWMLGVLAVFSTGRIAMYDGVRNFLLFMPPAAVLSAWGILVASDVVLRWIHVWRTDGPWPHGLIVPLVVLASIVPIARYHPYEVTFFNGLVGGIRGATEIQFGGDVLEFEPRDYWGTSVRASVDWANENLPRGSSLWVSLPINFGRFHQYRLRPDMVYAESLLPNTTRPHYLIFVNRKKWFREPEKLAIRHGELVHREEVHGVPLSFVYRIDHREAEHRAEPTEG